MADDEDASEWMTEVGRQIEASFKAGRGYYNMGLTASPDGEYTDSISIIDPIAPPPTFPIVIPKTSPSMTDAVPPWLVRARELIGKIEDGPSILPLAAKISQIYPEMKDYCAQVRSTTSWCGEFVAYCLAISGIRPPYNPNLDTDSFLWARAWLRFATATVSPQLGDVLVFDFGGGDSHVTFYNGEDGSNYLCLGGNQSDQVKISSYHKTQCIGIRRPPAVGVVTQPISVQPPIAAKPGQFQACVALVLKDEGGNDDDPRDPGGRTSRGILQREWDAWRQTHAGVSGPLPSDVWQAPQDQIIAIYRQSYWDGLSCDQLSAGVDYAVFDYGVNSGISRSAKVLQRLVGADVDGEIGPLTIAATAKVDPATLIKQICDERMAFLQGLGTWSTFGNGWTRRVNGVRANALAMVGKIPVQPPIEGEVIPPVIPIQPPLVHPTMPPTVNAGTPFLFVLILKLLEAQMANAPGQGPDAAGKILSDLPKLLSFLQNPVLQKLLNGGAVTLAELLSLPRELLGMLTGQVAQPALPPPVHPQPVPPAPDTQSVVPPAVPAPAATTPPWMINLSTGIAALATSLGLSATGVIGAPVGESATLTGMLLPLVSVGLSALGLPAPIIAMGGRALSAIFGAVASKPRG